MSSPDQASPIVQDLRFLFRLNAGSAEINGSTSTGPISTEITASKNGSRYGIGGQGAVATDQDRALEAFHLD